MKTLTRKNRWRSLLPAVLLLLPMQAFGQGTFVFQQLRHMEASIVAAKAAYQADPTDANRSKGLQLYAAYEQFRKENRTEIEAAMRATAPPEILAAGGPDGFGYTYLDSDEAGGPSVAFTSIANAGNDLTLGDDDASTVALGFSFDFYGTTYTAVPVGSNGYLNPLGDQPSSFFNQCPLPLGANPNGVIAPHWDDLSPNLGGSVHAESFLSCPTGSYSAAQCFVAEWNAVSYFGVTEGSATFQSILYPDGTIEYQIQDVVEGSQTTGIESLDAGTALTYVCNASYPTSLPLAVRFAVSSNTPPDCSGAVASPDNLWPPRHDFREIDILGVSDPDGDPVSILVTGIFQDEPVNGNDDGNTSPDGAGVGTSSASVRAERVGDDSEPGNGRVYHIDFEASDGQGGVCTSTVQVCVPHDQGSGGCVDEGPLYDSTAEDLPPASRPALGSLASAGRVPSSFVLEGNYPNPFNPATTITYGVPEKAAVRLVVYDMMGREVRVLVDATQSAGMHSAQFNAAELPSGLYVYRLDTPEGSIAGSMLLMK